MKKHRPVKHAHRKSMISQKKSKGKYSRCDLPKRKTCASMYSPENCLASWVNRKLETCIQSWCKHLILYNRIRCLEQWQE